MRFRRALVATGHRGGDLADVAVRGGVRVVPPAWLAVTKLEAFADRGAGDCLGSRDFEDLVLLIDAREELASELDALPARAQAYVRDEIARITQLATFVYGVEGALLGADAAARATVVTIPRTRLAGG